MTTHPMTTHPFRRYWCMTPDGIGICIADYVATRKVMFSDRTELYGWDDVRPATFREYLLRPEHFGNGIPYPLAAVWALFFTGTTVFALFWGDEFPELGWRIFTGLFGPAVMAVIILTMYRQFKRGR